jgi:nucleotide sugar dehydrogenase
MKIGVIGLGYVGSALFDGMGSNYDILSYDKFKDSSEDSVSSLVEKADIVFVCVPTPMKKDGSCDRSIVDDVLNQINECNKKTLITVLKSTLEIGSTEYFENQYSNLNLVFNPEFLTEANFLDDFKNQKFIILGSNNENHMKLLKEVYKNAFPNAKILTSGHKEAELSKYFINSFLAVKVSFANEIYSLCKGLDIKYSELVRLVSYEERVGNSHLTVPGPDGKMGFGGSCFPKDINSLITIFKNQDIESFVLAAAWERNIKIDRAEQDWKKLKGRAVSSKD